MRNRYSFIIWSVLVALAAVAAVVYAGDPDNPPGLPETASSLVAANIKGGVSIFGIAGTLYAPLPKTGQTTSYASGDDGDLQVGTAWPSPRFTDNGDGTVTDSLTGLIWLRSADCFGRKTWSQAMADANGLAGASCGLSDGSSAGAWRLPNVRELSSLVRYGLFDPVVPNTAGTGKWSEGDPFTGVQSDGYWTSSTMAGDTSCAWSMPLGDGSVRGYTKTSELYVWPVRGGQ